MLTKSSPPKVFIFTRLFV